MIVITTPTGDIGSQLLAALAAGDEPVRVVVRDAAKLPDGVRGRVDVVEGSHGDPDVLDRALAGADALFWVVPPNPAAASLTDAFSGFTRPAAEAIAAHRVGHVVGVSALGRGTPYAGRAGLVTASLAMDDVLAGSGAAFRALACAGFMDNVLRQTDGIRDAGVYADTVPLGRALPYVATRDIAATAAGLLTDRGWDGTGEVPLLGPEDLTPEELVATTAEVLGRPVEYRQQTLDELAAHALHFAQQAFADGLVQMMAAKHDGLDDGAPRDGRAARTPTTFRQWCEDVLAPAVRRW
ncbi:Rossmann-fold NAD(P)-binding domain-containing protein [Jatrophihabitans fulvus]